MAHGLFVDGIWRNEWYDTGTTGGRFVPTEPVFRNWVTPDGSAGPSGEGGFPAQRGRYHLYVSLACPYAHRTVIFRKLKELESVISMSVLDPVMGDQGWQFGDGPARRYRQRHTPPRRDLSARRSALYRPRVGAGAMGQGTPHHRQQRIARDHPHAQCGIRGSDQRPRRLLPAGPARRDRPHQCARLQRREYRRLSRRLRDDAAGV